MRTSLPEAVVQPLRHLPRDRKTLDFILTKLAACSSPERFDLLQELFEMHRTSVGFDPTVLSKARFKRFKAFEIKQVLAELEQHLAAILSSDDYLSVIEPGVPYKDLFDQYLIMLEMISAPPSKELNEQVDNFCSLLMKEGAHELLLSFYRQGHKHFEQRNGRLDGVIERYTALLSTVEFNSSFFLTGLQTIRITREDNSEISLQEELLLHLNSLNTLLDRAGQNSERTELTARAMRTAMLLHNRVMHLAPYIKSVLNAPSGNNEAGRAELLTLAHTFNVDQAAAVRIEELIRLEESFKNSEQHSPLIYIKLSKAVLYADDMQYAEARRSLNEAEHLLLRNGFRNDKLKKAWIELHLFRLLICCAEEMEKSIIYDMHEYNAMLQSIRDVSREQGYANPLADGFRGIIEYIKGNRQHASSCFEMMQPVYVSASGNYLTLIMSYFAALAGARRQKKKLEGINIQLEALREPFFSGAFRRQMTELK